MIAPLCKLHQIPMTLKPAGVSKTGKRYPSFWGCPDRTNGEFCKEPTILASEWEEQASESTTEAFKRSLEEEPVKTVEVEEPMKKKDWNYKSFTEGLRALSYDYRKEDQHPVDVWDKTHVKEWMTALYGDDEGFAEWVEALENRLANLKK